MPGTGRGAVETEMTSSGPCPWKTQSSGEDRLEQNCNKVQLVLQESSEQDPCVPSVSSTELLCVSTAK